MKRTILFLCSLLSLNTVLAAGATDAPARQRTISLDEAITLARVQSVDAAVALNELKTAYWEYRTFRADLLPEVNFAATLPSYNKSYNSYQQDDGSYTFVRNNYLQMNGQLSIDQNIWFTGGTLSLNTSLDFLRQLDGTVGNRFMSVPVALTLNQPIFGVNNIKWNRRIEPVRYAEAKAAFLSATEEVTMTTINHFFNLLLARENVAIARQNLANAEKLYEVAKAKRRMGQISENDLLQLELNVLDARSTLTSNESSLKSSMFTLRSFWHSAKTRNWNRWCPIRYPMYGSITTMSSRRRWPTTPLPITSVAASWRPITRWRRPRGTCAKSPSSPRWASPVRTTASIAPTAA